MYRLVDYYMKEHHGRYMQDGQIHHVLEVSEVIHHVKETLEKKHGNLVKVCVAAAGRSLKTNTGVASRQINHTPITDEETIKHLELSAVNQAQEQLLTEFSGHEAQFYCVGYSVLHYKLDNEIIGSLIDQSGQVASVEIIATFLPKVVIESLLSALHRAGLELEALTLEPIAAIHVLIPESMRRLNVALVDIGAGTSDIAITNQGTVTAYGMVPNAGDEITEAISDHYLLDFPLAEQAKREVVNNGETVVHDILGFDTTITYADLVAHIEPAIESLASTIAEEIFRLNHVSPKAVMLIGGGSLTPELTKILAAKLNLPTNRVAVRQLDAVQHLIKSDNMPTGPDAVTPIGIAISAQQNPIHYITVHVNEQVIRLFELKQLTIGDALIQANIEINKKYGRPGIAYMIRLNGKHVTLPGELGEQPKILLNDKPATVDTTISNGSKIIIEKGKDGKEPSLTINELLDDIPVITVYFQDQPYELKTTLLVNDEEVSKYYYIQDKDDLIVRQQHTIFEFLSEVSSVHLPNMEAFKIFVNGHPTIIDVGQSTCTVNDKQVSLDYKLRQYDRLDIKYGKKPSIQDILQQLDQSFWHKICVTFQHEPITLKQQQIIIKKDDFEVAEDYILKHHDHITIESRKLTPFIFQDIFRFVDVDLAQANGNFTLLKNGLPTGFDETIQDGDSLEIKWG